MVIGVVVKREATFWDLKAADSGQSQLGTEYQKALADRGLFILGDAPVEDDSGLAEPIERLA
jgi:hypothetical protein